MKKFWLATWNIFIFQVKIMTCFWIGLFLALTNPLLLVGLVTLLGGYLIYKHQLPLE